MDAEHIIQPDYGTGEKKFSVYVFGIFLCIILTLIPFASVIYFHLSRGATIAVIFFSAILQFIVQVLCFLRLNAKTPQAKMNVMAFLFTILILLVIVVGSLWIMWSLHYYMMH